MSANELKSLLQQIESGQLDADSMLEHLLGHERASTRTATTADVRIDLDRARRCGFPEVVFGEGKSADAVIQVFERQLERGQDCLATRLSAEQATAIKSRFPNSQYNGIARTLRIDVSDRPTAGKVPVITAGTSDRPVAEEALETLRWMRVDADLIVDVGVSGPHRLPEQLHRIDGADAVVVVAGMEGALPSIVGGWVDCPVVAVPTSVGYGASFGGLSALLGMLNSCASNVTVVNIDAGFKAAYVAGLIARRAASHRAGPVSPG
jgi:NCAIR mutase (PurE)-related protein